MQLALAEGFHVGGQYVFAMAAVGLALAVGIGALSHQHEQAFSASVVYIVLGALGAAGLAILDVNPLDPIQNHRLLEKISELALVVAIFAGGLTVEANVRRRSIVSVAILLLVVMPLTIAAVALFGYYAMGLSLGAAVLLGAILAPTDPVLAGDVGLGPPGSEPEGEPRFSLHTEAAINDGLASPFVVLGLFIALEGGTGWIGEWIWADLIYSVVVAAAIGAGDGGRRGVADDPPARRRLDAAEPRRLRRDRADPHGLRSLRVRSAPTGCSRCSPPASASVATSTGTRSTTGSTPAPRPRERCSSSPSC